MAVSKSAPWVRTNDSKGYAGGLTAAAPKAFYLDDDYGYFAARRLILF